MSTADQITQKCQHICQTTETYLTLLSNEPSLGIYYIHQHIRGSIKQIADIKCRLNTQKEDHERCQYQMNFSNETIEAVSKIQSFNHMNIYISQSMKMIEDFIKQDEEQQRSRRRHRKHNNKK